MKEIKYPTGNEIEKFLKSSPDEFGLTIQDIRDNDIVDIDNDPIVIITYVVNAGYRLGTPTFTGEKPRQIYFHCKKLKEGELIVSKRN